MRELRVRSYLDTIRSRVSFFTLLLLVTILSACKDKPLLADEFSAPIRQNILRADKAVGFYQTKPLFYEVTGANLESLSNVFQIEDFHRSFSCVCDADLILYFYEGEELIQVLGIHPDKSLRWVESDWTGDAILSSESVKRVNEWLSNVFDQLDPLPRGSFIAPELE